MNIPGTRRKSREASERDRGRPEESNPVAEGSFTASWQRATFFEPVDTRTRRHSSARHRDSSRVKVKPSISFSDSEGVTPDRVHGSDFRSFPTIEDQDESMTTTRTTTHASGVDEETPLIAGLDGAGVLVCGDLSTTAQTIFNMANLLIGIGLLSLPLGFRLAGWVMGTAMLLLGAVLTGYTAVLLTRSLETSPVAYAYSDIGALAYGRFMTTVTALIFMLELTAAGSALVILFGDNMHAVVPEVPSVVFKTVCLVLMMPATLLPLRTLSYTSIVGIVSTLVLIVVVFADGVYKRDAPGSLRDPLPTDWIPNHWSTLPLALGLFMAPFGGHGVFPQVYRDMRDRRQFAKSIWISYSFTVAVSLFVGVIGYLMFGAGVKPEITINLLDTAGYPKVLNQVAVFVTGLTSLTKIPLCTKSISANIDVYFDKKTFREERRRGLASFSGYLAIRVFVNGTIYLLAVAFPSFDRVMSVLGSSFVFLISAILPICFYLRITDKVKELQLTSGTRFWLYSLNSVCIFGAVVGTVFALLPRMD